MTSPWSRFPAAMAEKAQQLRDIVAGDPARHFPTISREYADAMRANRRPTALMMTPVDWNAARMPERAIVQIKWDGIHAGFHDAGPLPYTREGVPMECCSHLVGGLRAVTGALERLFGEPHLVFGEYCHPDGFDATLGDMARRRGSGVIQLFDAVPIAAYEGRAPSPPQEMRLVRLARAVDGLPHDVAGNVMVARSSVFEGDTRDQIEVMMPSLWAQGLEGVVVKDAAAPYVRGASPYWMRLKQRHTVDVAIISVDAPGGRLKALVVRAPDGNAVRVGVGFSQTQRAAPETFRPGMIVELNHLGVTGSGSLRSPSFLRIRADKKG